MAMSSWERINRIVTGKQIFPFDWFNGWSFYDPKPEPGTEYTDRQTARTKLINVASSEVSRPLKKKFIPCPMSNGYDAFRLVLENAPRVRQRTAARFGGEGFLTTQGMRHYIAQQEILNRVILPNALANHAFIDRLERKFPGFAMVGPIDAESTLRAQKGNSAFNQGASFQDWTFEAKYLPRVLECDGMILGMQHAWSRYANVEELLGDIIQCGMADDYRDRPGRAFDVTDENNVPVTLADRAWERAKHIVSVMEMAPDFRTDLAVGTLLAQFQIDDWLRGPDHGPIDMGKVHPVLANRDAGELARMDRLKSVMLPCIANRGLEGLPYHDDANLKAYVERTVLPLSGQPFSVREVKKELFAYQPVGGFVYPGTAIPASSRLTEQFSASTRAVKRRGTEGGQFQNEALLFEDHHFKKLPLWEQAVLPVVAAAMEDHRLAEAMPRSVLYVHNPKGGARAREWADRHGLTWLREAQSAVDPIDSDDSFYKSVIAPNLKETEKNQQALVQNKSLRGAGVENVVSTLNFLAVKAALKQERIAVATEASDVLSSRGFLALMMEWFDRNAEGLIVEKGWENHHENVQMVVRAVLHACGLVNRPYEGGRFRMDIQQLDPGAKNKKDQLTSLDLHDLLTVLGNRVERYMDADSAFLKGKDNVKPEDFLKAREEFYAGADSPAPAREEILALARLLHIADMRGDPGRMNGAAQSNPQNGAASRHNIIQWHNVGEGLAGFWDHDPAKRADLMATSASAANDNGTQSLRDRLRAKLLDIGVLFLAEQDLEGLHPDFEARWRDAHGQDSGAKKRDFEGRQKFDKWNGPA